MIRSQLIKRDIKDFYEGLCTYLTQVQISHNPGEQHMNAVVEILRYLNSAPGKGILFSRNVKEQSIDVYTDSDGTGDKKDRRPTSRYLPL